MTRFTGELPPPPRSADGRPYDVEDELGGDDAGSGGSEADDADEPTESPPGGRAAAPGGGSGAAAGRRPERGSRAGQGARAGQGDPDGRRGGGEAAAGRFARGERSEGRGRGAAGGGRPSDDRDPRPVGPVRRVKQRPSDFRVVEIVDRSGVVKQRGFTKDLPFAWHTLRKKKLTTTEAIVRVARLYGLPRSDFAYGGLKDKQSWSEQVVSIRGRALRHTDPQVKLSPLGLHPEAMASSHVIANRFTLTVRGLEAHQVDALPSHCADVQAQGLPNYFDSQRFGSVRFGQGLMARELVRGRPDEALRLFMATPAQRDHSSDRFIKEIIAEHWGDWEWLGRRMHASPYGQILGHLANAPDDFWGAVGCMHRPLRALHIFGYQSYLWNRTLALFLEDAVAPSARFTESYACGRHVFCRALPQSLADELRELEVPLLAPDMDAPDPKLAPAIARTLAAEGIDLEDLRLPESSGAFFKTEMRCAILTPKRLEVEPAEPDALNDGKLAVRLGFELPRGAYATLVIKRLFPTFPRP